MNDIYVSLDYVRFKSKPSGSNIPKINNRIGRSVKKLDPTMIKSFTEDVGNYGQTFCPSTFHSGVRKKENFEQMHMFALDFDGSIAIHDAIDRTEKYDLPILFIYETFSSVNSNKFRIVFLNDTSITDIRVSEIMINALLKIFPEADKHCKDVTHMYYGGKKLLYYDDTIPTINIDSLIRNMTLYLKDRHGTSNYKRELLKFAKYNNIAMTDNKMLDISITEISTESSGAINFDKNSPKSIILNRTFGDNLSNIQYVINLENGTKNSVENNSEKKILKNHAEYRSSILKDISNKCKLYKEFENGSRILGHDELFGIGNTMIQIETGVTKFINNLKDNNYFDDRPWRYNKWKNNLKYNKMQGYRPTSCNNFCPYRDTCTHGTNILSTVKPKYNTMERIAGYKEEFYPLDEVIEDVKEKIQSAVETNDKKWHIIKAQTAIGKTEICLDIMKDSTLRFLYATPTNILKHDICKRAKKKGIEVFKTPSLHDDKIRKQLPNEVKNQIDFLYNSGQYNLVNSYISEVAEEQNIDCLKEYQEQMEKFRNFDGHIITTHRRLLHMDEETLNKFDVIIVDEDILLKSIIPNQVEIPIPELKKLIKTGLKEAKAGRIKYSLYKQLHRKIMKVLEAIETDTMFHTQSFVWNIEESNGKYNKEPMDCTSTPIDVQSFCIAEHFYFRKVSVEKNLTEDSIVFLKPSKFKDNFKYIMISATADETICKHYFGKDNVNFYECKKAQYLGTLNQFYDKSMSRTCIHNNPGIIENIKEKTSFEHTIVFKKFAKEGDLYFGNNEGVDYLKGQNIDVIGTPYYAGFLYKLFPYTIGLKFDVDAKPKPNLPVTYNGYLFRFTTYEDQILRDIQFWMIESDLEQAVGRARLLRCNCSVNLFSNFPLSQAIMKKFEYDNT